MSSRIFKQKFSDVNFDPREEQAIRDNNIADCAYLLAGGEAAARHFLTWYGLDSLNQDQEPLLTAVMGTNVGSREIQELYQRYCLDELEKIIQYKFNDTSLLIQAVSHRSVLQKRGIADDCMKRLGFLGDSVLNYLITGYIFDKHKKYSPGKLTVLRSYLVSNKTLGRSTVKIGIHKYLQHESSDLKTAIDKLIAHVGEGKPDLNPEDDVEDVEVPKVLADMFEAILGAVYIDSKESLTRRNLDKLELEEAIKLLSHADQELLWESTFQVFSTSFIDKYFRQVNINPANKNDADTDFHSEDDNSELMNENKEMDLELLSSIFELASTQIEALFIKEEQYTAPPEKLIQFVVLIGGLLSEFENDIQKSAVDLCEKWILKNMEGKRQIYANTLLTLITLGLAPKAKKQEIKRIWALQPDFSFLSLKTPDDAQSSVGKLLLSCVTSPNYLNPSEGKKFLCKILLTPALLKQFHETFRNRVPYLTKVESIAYADIYVRAWRHSNGEIKQKLEEDCFQDLMYLAVHIDPFASKAFDNLMAFFHFVHQNKRHVETGTMIYRQYEPFIWRSLKVANGYVRMNAATLFCDAFPFHDGSLNKEEKEAFMDQQYQSLLVLLVDPCHLVRIAAIKGLSPILTDYWLIMPSHIIQKIFQILTTKLLVDASSHEIRVEVLKLIIHLLDCADAAAFITEILPRISESFDDVNASVRIAFIKLLIKVKSTSLIKYWKLVSLDHLLNRLANDVPNVRTLISVLIQPSFLLSHFTEQEMFHRCISLVETNREAARRFYQFAAKGLDVESTARFILYIWRAIHRFVQTRNIANISSTSVEDSSNSSVINADNSHMNSTSNSSSKKRRLIVKSQTNGNKENSAPNKGFSLQDSSKENHQKDDSNETSKLPLEDPNVVGGLLDTIIILWTVNSPRLGIESNFKYLDALRARISKTFPLVFSFFKGEVEIPKTLLYLSSFLPSSLMPTMVGLCLSRLKSVEDYGSNYSPEDSYTTYLNALANWNRMDDIMELVAEWLESVLHQKVISPQSRTKRKPAKKSRVCFQEKITPKPFLALNFLHHILAHPLNRMVLLKKNRNCLLQVCELMSGIKKLIKQRSILSSQISTNCSDEFLLKCWEDYLCIVSILHWKPDISEDLDQSGNTSRRLRKANKSVSMSESQVEEFDGVAIHSDNFDFILQTLPELDKKNYIVLSLVYQCAFKMINASTDFVAIGGADIGFTETYLSFIKELIDCFSTYQNGRDLVTFMHHSCRGIREVHNYLSVYSKNNSHKLPVTSYTERHFHHLVTFLSQGKSAVSELSERECQNISENFTKTISVLMQDSDILLDTVSLHLVTQMIKILSSELKSHAGTLPVVDKVTDLSNEGKIILLSIHKNTKMAEVFMEALSSVYTESLPEICDILAATILLSLLLNDSGKVSRHSLKEVTIVANDFLEKLDEPSVTIEKFASDELTAGNSEFFRFCALEAKKMIGEIKTNLGLEM